MGSYYIFEIYARKKNLKEILTDSDIQKIQKEIDKRGLTYQLVDLNDRIGNIVCKFENETLKVKPIRLGKNGIFIVPNIGIYCSMNTMPKIFFCHYVM